MCIYRGFPPLFNKLFFNGTINIVIEKMSPAYYVKPAREADYRYFLLKTILQAKK